MVLRSINNLLILSGSGAPAIYINTANNVAMNGILSFGSRVQDYLIKLYGDDYGFGINGSTLRYNAPSGASHKFYIGTTEKTKISSS